MHPPRASDPSAPPARRRRAIQLLPALAVLALGAVIVTASLSLLDDAGGASEGASGFASAASQAAWRNDPVRLAAIEELREQMEAGWVPFHGDPGVPGVEVPDGLWLAWDHSSFERVALEYPMRRASVHAGQAGPIVGYYYEDVGYIPADMAADFDPEPVRAAREACDGAADTGC